MTRSRYLVVLVAWFSVLGCAHAVTLEVREGNSTCIKAELSAILSITYNTSNGTTTAQVSLPDSTSVDTSSSSCGSDSSSPWLVGVFGAGHTLGLGFSTNGSTYSVANLTLQYNLSDPSVFPQANSSDVVTVVSSSVGIWARVNTTYRCESPASVRVGGATVTFSNMKMEAYMSGGDLSATESVCTADQVSTTVPPPPPVSPTTPAPVPTPPGTPERGTYLLTSNGTECLLAQMGLQLNVSYFSLSQNKTVQETVNLNPNLTTVSGSCAASRATLELVQERITNLTFIFTLNSTSNKYHLSGLTLVAAWPDMTANLSASNTSLDYLRSTLGHSYMCNAEETLVVEPAFSLNTFRLQVQPFGVTTKQFATAEECRMDQDQMLIPIIVGAALSGLVLIVLIAYLIGRKRSHAGYQTI
ncbi:lysosome-associated membrane glycoprotein 1a [Polymixia lowei]